MARKLLPPTEFNAAAVRETAKAAWLEKRRKSVSVLEHIERSQPYWLFFILFAVILLSASHTTAAFQQVIGTKIYINADLSIPLGSVGVIAIEFGLLYASFGRFRAHQKRVKRSSRWF
jgi:polyferredoxin